MPFDPLPRQFIAALEQVGVASGIVLDLGCGDGVLAGLMAAHGVRSVGLDLVPPAAGTSAAVVGEALTPPVRARTCDMVVASNLVRHLVPRRPELDFVRAWTMLLKPGGMLFLFEDLAGGGRPDECNFCRLQDHLAALSPTTRGPLLGERELVRMSKLQGVALLATGRQVNHWRLDRGRVLAMLDAGNPEPGGSAATLVADIRDEGIACGSYWWACLAGET